MQQLHLQQPETCRGCPLHNVGTGFSPAAGPPESPLMFMGEALGREEAWKSEPFVGAAGALLNRALKLASIDRPSAFIRNVVNCFPGETLVEAAGIEKAYRRWFSGELVTLHAGGNKLTGTPNHPALTTRGWVPLGSVVEGDHLVRGLQLKRGGSRDPHEHQGPTSFADAFRALAVAGVGERVVGSHMDFHGDGSDAEIDVVTQDGLLRNWSQLVGLQHVLQHVLETPDLLRAALVGLRSGLGSTVPLFLWDVASADGGVSGFSELQPPFPSEALKAPPLSSGPTPQLHTSRQEGSTKTGLPDPVLHGEGLQAGPSRVGTTQVLKVERSSFSGHVYNLQTKSGEYLAEGFIVHNCQPPNNILERAPYEVQAIACCTSRYTYPSVAEWRETASAGGKKVLVTLGGVPLKFALGIRDDIRVQDFHGTKIWSNSLQCWVVPTYHPSHIQRGAFNLLHVMKHDLETALEVSQGTYLDEPIDTILDPSVEWFESWVNNYVDAVLQDPEIWLAVDIETPDKEKKQDEGELTSKDRDYHILRVNLSCHPDEGVTVPFQGPYKALIQRALATSAPKIFWNWRYDVPRLLHHEQKISGMILDAMEMWHKLQSDLPRGLGFVAPFYSHYGPWKHLAHKEPVLYAALDGPQTLRIAHGVARDLQETGSYLIPFFRHVYMLDTYVLKPMEDEGLLISQGELATLKVTLQEEREKATAKLREIYPADLRRLEPKQGLVTHPGEGEVLEKQVQRVVKVCTTCGATEVSVKHRCKKDPSLLGVEPQVEQREITVTRYYRPEEFNPRSTQQILAYIQHKRHRPGKNKKTKAPSADKQAIDWLIKNTKDPFYSTLKKMRAAATVESTYVDGTIDRLKRHPLSQVDGRLHPTTTHKPSTQRTSMQDPNLQNVIARSEHGSLASLFRRVVIAEPGSYLLEADFSGIEAVLTGLFMGDPDYIRWARRGVHALVAAHLLARQGKIPQSDIPDLSWPEEEIVKMLKHIKKNHEGPYNQCKRCVHGKNYGLTVRGMVLQFPDEFPNLKIAREIESIYYELAPKLPQFHAQIRERAAKQGYLGGSDHPFHYKHWFFNVLNYKPVPPGVHRSEYPIVSMGGRNWFVMFGEDAKRCVAFYPQSTAAGIIKEVMLRLFADPDAPNYIGDAFHGRTPLRAPIHDSLLLEVPQAQVDRVTERLVAEMTRAIEQLPLPAEWNLGPYLTVGVEVKLGKNWAGWNEDPAKGVVNLEGMKGLELPSASRIQAAQGGLLLPGTLAGDTITPLDEYDEELSDDELEGLQSLREVI